MNAVTKAAAKRALGIETDIAFGEWFHDRPSKQAVSQWAEDGELPPARVWELRARRPDLFPAADPPDDADPSVTTPTDPTPDSPASGAQQMLEAA